jgi:hypothetical protein
MLIYCTFSCVFLHAGDAMDVNDLFILYLNADNPHGVNSVLKCENFQRGPTSVS